MTSANVTLDPERLRESFSALHPQRKARRILVVEDDADLLTVFVRVVRSVDPEAIVDWAISADEAMKYLRANTYNAIVADYMLPGPFNGLSLREPSRRRQPAAVFAVMSAHPMVAAGGSSQRRPFPFLSKPFSVAQCRQFIDRVLFPN